MNKIVINYKVVIGILFFLFFISNDSFANIKNNPEKIIKEIDSILIYTPDSLIINSIVQKALYYKDNNDYNASIIAFEKLFRHYRGIDKKSEKYNKLMFAKRYLGDVYNFLGLKNKSIEIGTEVLLHAREKKDTLLMISVLNSLTYSYNELKETEKGEKYIIEAYNLSKKYQKSPLAFYTTIINTASMLIDIDKLDLALNYLDKVDLTAIKNTGVDVYYYLNKGDVFYRKGDFNKAIKCCKNAEDTSNKIKKYGEKRQSFNVSEIYINELYSKIYYAQDKLDLAEKRALLSLEITSKNKNYLSKIEALKILSEIYQKKKNTIKYHLYHQKYTALKDSIKISDLETSVENVKLLYEIDNKENEIFMLKTKEKEKNSRIRFLLLSLVTIIMISIVYFFQRNKKYKVYRKLYIENVKAVVSHDEIFKLKKEASVNRLQNNNNEEKDNKEEKEFLSKKQIDEIELLILTALEEKVFLDKNLTLNKFAKIINTNTSYLSYVINTCFNHSFSDLINEQRVNWAKKLLLKDNIKYTIESIALSSGFSNSVTFNRNFKKITGITPSVYLKLSNESVIKSNSA